MSDTPVLRRFSENNSIAQGINQSALSMDDIAPVQHMTGDLEDKAMKLKQAVAVPQLIVTSFNSNRIGTATCLNFPSFEPVLGQPLDITFSAAYTAAGVPSVTFGGLTLQVKAQGTAVGKGFNILPATDAKRSFHATVKTTATVAGTASGQSQDKSTWYLDLDSNIVSVEDGVITQSDGTTVYNKQSVDTSLSNYKYMYQLNKTLNQAGWYRIANIVLNINVSVGFELTLTKQPSTSRYEYHKLDVEFSTSEGGTTAYSQFNVTKLNNVNSTSSGGNMTKIRLVKDTSLGSRGYFLDVYYNSSAENTCYGLIEPNIYRNVVYTGVRFELEPAELTSTQTLIGEFVF